MAQTNGTSMERVSAQTHMMIRRALDDLVKALAQSELGVFVTNDVHVANIDELKLANKKFMEALGKLMVRTVDSQSARVAKAIPQPEKFPESFKVSNFPKQKDSVRVNNLKGVMDELKAMNENIVAAVKSLDMNPIVQPASVNLPETTIDLKPVIDALKPLQLITNKATKPISVRNTDGRNFMKAVKAMSDNVGRQVLAVSQNTGLTDDEFRTINRNNDDILNRYKIQDKDDDASPNYYGFADDRENWYILKETVSAGADTYRYAKGGSDYATNWTGRAGLSYDYFYSVF